MKTIIAILLSLASGAYANEALVHGFTAEESQIMAMQNEKLAAFDAVVNGNRITRDNSSRMNLLPYAEYNKAGYLIFSADYEFSSKHIKEGLVKNLPSGVTVIIFTGSTSKSYHKSLVNEYSRYISKSRLKVIHLPRGGRGFWARDGIPVPLVPKASAGMFTVVDAVYYHSFEADQEVASLFGADMLSHQYYYEGGNFMANGKGDCLIVDKVETQKMPDSVFHNTYGCKTLTRLPHVKGIGHADESVKFISDNTVLTDEQSYVSTLKGKGFKVVMLPRPEREMETYVNSLLVNGTLYLPVFNESGDQTAIDIYRKLGFKVVALNSETLSNRGQGSIHCITMTYPPGPFKELLHVLDAKDLLN